MLQSAGCAPVIADLPTHPRVPWVVIEILLGIVAGLQVLGLPNHR